MAAGAAPKTSSSVEPRISMNFGSPDSGDAAAPGRSRALKRSSHDQRHHTPLLQRGHGRARNQSRKQNCKKQSLEKRHRCPLGVSGRGSRAHGAYRARHYAAGHPAQSRSCPTARSPAPGQQDPQRVAAKRKETRRSKPQGYSCDTHRVHVEDGLCARLRLAGLLARGSLRSSAFPVENTSGSSKLARRLQLRGQPRYRSLMGTPHRVPF